MRPKSASVLLRGPPLSLGDVMKQGYLQRIRDLVDLGLDVDSRDREGKTPLMICALVEPEGWGVGIARHLIENGADLRLRDKTGLNALHHACIYERYELSKVFLRAIDFNLNQQDRYGNTALHYTVRSGNLNMVNLLVDYLKKYRMKMGAVNKMGCTALDLAYRYCSECVYLLKPKPESTSSDDGEKETDEAEMEKTDVSEKDYQSEHLSLTESNLKTFCEQTVPCIPAQRPKTALLKRRRSSCSSTSSMSSGGKSHSKLIERSISRVRDTKVDQANEKNAERIIHCVSLSDFRNTKEYVFKLTAIPYDELEADKSLPLIRRPPTAWTPRPEPIYPNSESKPFSWRTEFKKLYVEYEFQCSPSWRDAAKPIVDLIPPPSTPPPPEEEEEKIRDRRGSRRASMSSNKSLNVEALKDKRRSSGNIKARKMSSTGLTPHTKPSTADNALVSSSESLNSSNSSRKKELQGKTDLSGKSSSSPDKDSLKNLSSSIQIPAVTETLVGDNDDDTVTEDTSLLDSNRLSILSDIDEDT